MLRCLEVIVELIIIAIEPNKKSAIILDPTVCYEGDADLLDEVDKEKKNCMNRLYHFLRT